MAGIERPIKPVVARPRAPTKPRELHIFDEGVSEKRGMRKFRIEIHDTFLGNKRILRKFPVLENHVPRMKDRYMREFRVPKEMVFEHAAPTEVTAEPKP